MDGQESVGRPYQLVTTQGIRKSFSNAGGSAVFFDIDNAPGIHTLLDGRSGDTITTIDILPAKPGAGIPLGGPNCGGPYTGPCIAHEGRTPKPAFSDDPAPGMVSYQGAYSFSPDVTIRVASCWDHRTTVKVKASGGMALRSEVGGDYTISREECVEIPSRGQAFEYRREHQFQRDFYDDGSERIYSFAEGTNRVFGGSKTYFNPPEDRVETVTVYANPLPPVLKWREQGSSGVFYSGGAQVFGTGLNVVIGSTDANSAEVRAEFAAPPEGSRQYELYVASGRPSDTSGMVVAVWPK